MKRKIKIALSVIGLTLLICIAIKAWYFIIPFILTVLIDKAIKD